MTPPTPDRRGASLTAADVVALASVLAVAVLASASLGLAHLGRHSLPGVGLASGLGLALLAVLFARVRGELRVTADLPGLAVVLAAGALAAFMFLPGFPYGVADKDPGVYVAHAHAISRTASVDFEDPASATPGLPVELSHPRSRFPGIWLDPDTKGRILPQFYHLWPALLASAHEAGGTGAVQAATPLMGILAVMALAALLLRLGGLAAAAIGGLLLATNMIEVWAAKSPGAEMLSQALFVGAMLALVVALQTRWRPAALAAGLLVGVAFLNRPDGWLLVVLGAAALAALYASRRDDALAAWGAAGLAAVLPYALWQAYAKAGSYSLANGLPGAGTTLALLGALVLLATAARLWLPQADRLPPAWTDARAQRRAGVVLCGLFAAGIALALLRPRLFGEPTTQVGAETVRTWDERNLLRLSWFVTLPGIALAWAGLAVVALRRWSAAVWVAVVPVLLLTVVYVYEARVAARLMWWTRRYVPTVLPGLIVLIALALAFALAWRVRGRRVLAVPALAAALGLSAVFLSQSLPLRDHREWDGSSAVSQRISRLSGPFSGVYLWQRSRACCAQPEQLWPTPVWLEHGHLSVLLPQPPTQLAYVRAYRRAFPRRPLFVVADDAAGPPAALRPLGLVPAARFTGGLPFWREEEGTRPDGARRLPYDFRVFRVPDASGSVTAGRP